MAATSIGDLVSLGLAGTQVMRGWQQDFPQPDPAAGTTPVYRHVPGDTWERPVAAFARLVTSAAVANRVVRWDVQNWDNQTISRIRVTSTVAASSSITMSLGFFGAANLLSAAESFASLPDLLLPPGWSYGYSVTGMDAADQLSNIMFVAQRFPTDKLTEIDGQLGALDRHLHAIEDHTRRTYERICAWLDGETWQGSTY